VRVEPLYRLTFRYRRHWDVSVNGELHRLLDGEGRCEGRISGTFRGLNYARRRTDGPYEPDYRGVIETDDGANILFHLVGYGFTDERRVTATVMHLAEDERYRWLSDVVCAVNGELRDRSIVLDVLELVWESLE
jgi:hypothetical protein